MPSSARLRSFLAASILFLTSFSLAIANEPEASVFDRYNANPILAEINGQPIRFEDVRDKDVQDAAQNFFQQLSTKLPGIVLEKLAETHPEINPAPEFVINDDMVKQFYTQNRLENRGTLVELTPQIRGYLETQLKQESIFRQFNQALQKGWVQTYLEPPSEFLIETSLAQGYLRGNPQAKVILLEYSDYQCPFCRRVQSTLDQLIKDYGDRVAFGYRHFPLPFHKEADEAAVAVECAREQGQFEPLHKLLFENQKEQFPENLIAYAKDLDLKNPDAYETCIKEDRYRSRVLADIQAGQAAGVSGTPGFFVGTFEPKTGRVRGELLSGARPMQDFRQTLEKYLVR